MSYQVLARKYRPQKFTEVAGQQHVLNSLIHALDNNRLHHAYLFTGTRGVGKTSLARLLAKSLNCLAGISSVPCEKCQHCTAIKAGNFVDLIEIDAASRTKVEDTREILENIQYMPSQGRFKIYLIDEVHMLSNHSFNALLKTLEEPPQHIKFILATTDAQKLPATILSRCLQFHLKHLTEAQICAQLVHVLKREAIDYQDGALKLIAHAATGSMRDALSLADQAIAFGDGKVLNQEIKTMLGIVNIAMIDDLLGYIIQSDSENIIALSNQIIGLGKDPIVVLDALAESFYAAGIYQLTQKTHCLACSKSRLIDISQQLSPQLLQHYYHLTIKAKKDIPLAPTAECGLGMALLRLCALQSIDLPKHQNSTTCVMPDNVLEIDPEEVKTAETLIDTTKPPDNTQESIPLVIDDPLPTKTAKETENNWYHLSQSLALKGAATQVLLNSSLESAENNLYKLKPNQKIKALITKNTQQKIEAALSHYLGQKTKIQFIEDSSVDTTKPVQEKHENNAIKITPAEIRQHEKTQKTNEIMDSLSNNPDIKKLEKLGFTVDVNSIRLKKAT